MADAQDMFRQFSIDKASSPPNLVASFDTAHGLSLAVTQRFRQPHSCATAASTPCRSGPTATVRSRRSGTTIGLLAGFGLGRCQGCDNRVESVDEVAGGEANI